jgi:hypothetical protein
MGTTEIITATLRGMGHSVECRVMVTRSDMQRESAPAYVRCGMLDAPADLPDGYYEAVFCGHTAFMHRANGCWSVGIPWRQFAARDGAGAGQSAEPSPRGQIASRRS